MQIHAYNDYFFLPLMIWEPLKYFKEPRDENV